MVVHCRVQPLAGGFVVVEFDHKPVSSASLQRGSLIGFGPQPLRRRRRRIFAYGARQIRLRSSVHVATSIANREVRDNPRMTPWAVIKE